ncbi:ABC transporter ATP-binding protein [Oceanobacillus caeni]|uniref:ABC transporter ATP-binding protein n=1 Tax=Oceanobacillus caeni TaxID=405946 RepID=A0ABR5MLZ4_9BACI|nr:MULTISPECIES: ABC transporter ATP-binding protein [Bacillaceae]KKE80454.1 ABC transporter ATP-binding protein [Bacilli bacterium VT-13-104]PZD83207.1 ABC transporter ATP-binding protein [Bacilli bacterium]KPH77433.1 ABC transporter ATP-binding protein [Oceanobacillus caeni]MBU8790699.1 ABC transporter ATP-binding protein [Oceanobacillus caeni]MCR1835115.1 ABC transporter ATP-binding protein [Oceanobacillus caeni]
MSLEIHDISKSFEDNHVLSNINFSVKDGEFVSLLGPSGSGKSTLFSIIGGMSQPSGGSIYLDREKINGKRGSISYMPQSSSLFPWRTILDNVVLGQEIAGKVDKEKALEMIERAGLKGYENSYPRQLSGGMKQRVSFIRSLLSPQSLILLDEPFSALDEFTRTKMQKWLLSIWEEHKRSILFITHNIEEAIFLSDRIIILSNKPATVKKEFIIPFDRPRDVNLLLSEEFLTWKKKIYEEM